MSDAPGPGHNSAGGLAADRLRSFIDRVEKLEEEKSALAADIREVYAEAKGEGFCAKTMRRAVVRRRKDKTQREEEDAMLALYEDTLESMLS